MTCRVAKQSLQCRKGGLKAINKLIKDWANFLSSQWNWQLHPFPSWSGCLLPNKGRAFGVWLMRNVEGGTGVYASTESYQESIENNISREFHLARFQNNALGAFLESQENSKRKTFLVMFLCHCFFSLVSNTCSSSCLSSLQSESKWDVFVMVISSTLHMNDFAPGLALKRRQTWTRK